MQKIALEEHFQTPGFERYSQGMLNQFAPEFAAISEPLLPEFDRQRLQAMDDAGVEISVLSQTAPGVQREPDAAAAIAAVRRSNDFLAARIAEHPSRFRGFACVPLQDPVAAAAELQRCVQELGFVGALVNSHTNGHYLDEEPFRPFWEKLVELDVPLYLHPADAYVSPHVFSGHPEFEEATWGWTCETGAHALRLVFGGVFERYPSARVILGHMGEALPFELWRFDSRAATMPIGRAMVRPPSYYIRTNIVITTSGVCAHAPLLSSLAEMGEDSVMFSRAREVRGGIRYQWNA